MEKESNSTVIIQSKTNSNFLKYSLSLLDGNNDKLNNLTSYSIGNIFLINNINYILTCNHCIKNTYNQHVITPHKIYTCNTLCTSPELELGLLEINNLDNPIPYNTIDDLDINLNDFGGKIQIETFDIDTYIQNKTCQLITLDCTFHDISEENIISLNIPHIPYIRVTLNKKYNDASQLSGLSGSIVKRDNKIFGLVSSLHDSYINIIPAYCIYRFLNEFKTVHTFNGICTLMAKFTACSFDTERDIKQMNGLLIENVYDQSIKTLNEKEQNRLLKTDIIFEIDGKKLDKYNKIYDCNIKIPIHFQVYIALNYRSCDRIPMKVMRAVKNEDYEEKEISIYTRPLNSMKYIPMEFNGKIYEFANMKFIELSEDIINDYISLGIDTGGSVGDYYIQNPYREDSNHFVVILIDINKSKLSQKVKDTINKIGLPVVPISGKKHSLAVITKINKNNKINCLRDFELATNDKKITIYINLAEYGKVKIDVVNDNIEYITKYR